MQQIDVHHTMIHHECPVAAVVLGPVTLYLVQVNGRFKIFFFSIDAMRAEHTLVDLGAGIWAWCTVDLIHKASVCAPHFNLHIHITSESSNQL
jgi:hypothetical protein